MGTGEFDCCRHGFDSGHLLRRALDSIVFHGPIKFMLVDDGSTNCYCRDIAGEYDHLVREVRANGGHAAALNSGVAEVRTALIVFLGDDDEWLNCRMQRQIDLVSSTSADVVVGAVRNVTKQDDQGLDKFTDYHCTVGSWTRTESAGLVWINHDAQSPLRLTHGATVGVIHRHASRENLGHHLRRRMANRTGA